MEKGYIAGGLFSDAQIRQRKYEGEILRNNTNIDWYNPIDADINDKTTMPTAQDIFNGDTSKIIESSHIIAELDGNDVGVAVELGIACGINFMLDGIRFFIDGGFTAEETIAYIINGVPFKTVYAHLSDIRMATANKYEGRYVPFGNNQYLIGAVEQMGGIFNHFEDIVEYIKEKEAKN